MVRAVGRWSLIAETAIARRPRGRVLDPCRGDAQPFYKVLLKQPRCSVDWCEIGEGRDFLRYNQKLDWIISNPPWSKILVFIKHALATR